jgi:hypothetical protein
MKTLKISIIVSFLILGKLTTSDLRKDLPIIDTKLQSIIETDTEIKEWKNSVLLIQQRLEWGYDERTQLKVKEIADKLFIPEQWLYDIFFIECRHDHHLPNPYSNAIGLIQFIPLTARWLGTSTYELSKMTKYEQLNKVYAYLRFFKNKKLNSKIKYNNIYTPEPRNTYKSKEQLYLAIFYPAALNKEDFCKIGGKKTANVNPFIDINKDGQILKNEVFNFIKFRTMGKGNDVLYNKQTVHRRIGELIRIEYSVKTAKGNVPNSVTGRIRACTSLNIVFAYSQFKKEILINYSQIKKIEGLNETPPINPKNI